MICQMSVLMQEATKKRQLLMECYHEKPENVKNLRINLQMYSFT